LFAVSAPLHRHQDHPAMKRIGAFFRRLHSTWVHWNQDDAGLLAAAVAYYLGLSFFPLFLLLLHGAGLFLEFTKTGRDAQDQLLLVVSSHFSLSLTQNIRELLDQVQSQAWSGGLIGFTVLLLSAIALFTQFQRAFDRIWNVPDPDGQGMIATILSTLTVRLYAFCMLLTLGALILVTFVAGLILAKLQQMSSEVIPVPDSLWKFLEILFTVSINVLAFTLLYRTLPKAKVLWSQAAQGALLAAVFWELGRLVLSIILIGDRYSVTYGLIGSFIAVQLWAYFGVSVIFLGAEYIRALSREAQAAESAAAASQPS